MKPPLHFCYSGSTTLFFFHTIAGVRRSINVLDPDNQLGSGSGKVRTGSGVLGLTDTKSSKTKKKFLKLSKISMQ